MEKKPDPDKSGKKTNEPSAADVVPGDAEDKDKPDTKERIANSYYYDDSYGYEIYDPEADDGIDPEL